MAGEVKNLQFSELTEVDPPTLAPLAIGLPAVNTDAARVIDVLFYDIVVSSSATEWRTHSTLAAGLAAATANQRILVKSSEALATTVTTSLDGIEIVFLRGVTMSDGGAVNGLVLNGNDNIIRMGRWSAFTAAIQVNGARTRLYDINFSGNTTSVDDQGTATLEQGLLNE